MVIYLFVIFISKKCFTFDILRNLLQEKALLENLMPKIGTRLKCVQELKEYLRNQENLDCDNLSYFQNITVV